MALQDDLRPVEALFANMDPVNGSISDFELAERFQARFVNQNESLSADSGDAQVDALVADYIKGFERDDFIARCIEFEVPAAPVNTIADIFADPHVKARGTLVDVPDSSGNPVTMPNVVPRLSQTPGRVESAGPLLGDATEQVLTELCGLDAQEIARLRKRGVV